MVKNARSSLRSWWEGPDETGEGHFEGTAARSKNEGRGLVGENGCRLRAEGAAKLESMATTSWKIRASAAHRLQFLGVVFRSHIEFGNKRSAYRSKARISYGGKSIAGLVKRYENVRGAFSNHSTRELSALILET